MQPSCGNTLDLSLNGGWAIPTPTQWLASFANTLDVYNTFTLNGTGQLCASPYFNSGYSWCDSGDVQSGYIWGAPAPIGNSDANNEASDSFLVQTATPEPSSLALMVTGLVGSVAAFRRKFFL